MNALRGQTAVGQSSRLRFFSFDEGARSTQTRCMTPAVAVQLFSGSIQLKHPPVRQEIGTANAQQVPRKQGCWLLTARNPYCNHTAAIFLTLESMALCRAAIQDAGHHSASLAWFAAKKSMELSNAHASGKYLAATRK